MRNRTVKTFFLITVVFGVASAAYLKDKEKKERAPSSLPKKIWLPAPVGKHLALVKIDITPMAPIPNSSEETVTLKGRILVQQSTPDGVSYRWHLPTEVELIQGQSFKEKIKVPTGTVLETEITVRGFSNESQQKISLQAFSKRGREQLGGSALIVSRPDETFEAKAPQMREAVEVFQNSKSKFPREL